METVNYGELASGYDLRKSLLNNGLVKVSCPNPLKLEEFEALSESLGKPLVTDRHVLNDKRTVQELSNNGLFSNDDVGWHHDWSYGRGNYFGTILQNVKNAHLSPTWFCDMSKAPQSLKDDYVGMIGSYYPPVDLLDKCFTDRQLKLLSKQKVTRPFIINHHVTNEEILYYSISTIQEVSPKLLWEDLEFNNIKEWIEENAIIHEWEDNDILIWDNLKMQHKRVAFEGERMLWRTQFII